MPFRPIAAVGVLAVACALSGSVVPASAASVAQPYDFFGDNHPDLVVGVPRLPVGPQLQAGGLFVLPASASGLSLTRQVLTQETADVPGEAESANHFGSTFASADFDHDGYADLAVGVPDKDLGQVENTGSVVILFGSETGLTGTRSYALSRTGGARGDKFGTAVVASDFNKDGWADLAIGAPGADAVHVDGEGEDAYASGSVTLLRGGPGGFANARSTVLHGRRTGPKHDLSFGSALAAGDLAGNRSVDLAVAAEGYAFSDGAGYRGSVSGCLSGSALPTSCTQLQSGNRYAGLSALAVGNVKAGSRSEIVVGVPNPDAEVANAGSVTPWPCPARVPRSGSRRAC